MKNKLNLILLLVLFSSLSLTAFCQLELEWITSYNIEISEKGSARWNIERKVFLETQYDEATFSYYSTLEHHNEVSNNINALVKEARLKTGRWNMTRGPLTVKTSTFRTATGCYGVVTYRFEWTEFANIAPDSEKIEIGDTFVEGFFLFGDGELTIEYPSGYVAAHVFPDPDEIRESDQTIIWSGLESLSVKELKLVLRKKHFMDFLHDYAFLVFGAITIVIAGFSGFWFLRRRKKERKAVIPPTSISVEIEDDEDKVVKLLRAAGGRLYQSTITKQCGFSKTKTSLLLTTMEKKGKVTRKKMGREKLVILADKEFKETKNKGG